MLTKIQRFAHSSLAKEALKSKKNLKKDLTNYMVSSDFYRIDMAAIVYRQPIHLVMDDIEFENLKLDHEINQKYLKNLNPDPKLIDFLTDFGSFNTLGYDKWSTHSKVLEGEELEQHLEEAKIKDSFYAEYLQKLADLEKNKRDDDDDEIEEDSEEISDDFETDDEEGKEISTIKKGNN